MTVADSLTRIVASDPRETSVRQGVPLALSVDHALEFAVKLHRAGELDGAETLYGKVLEACPDHPDALQFLGVLKHRRGDRAAALALLERAIAILPREAGFRTNLGNVLLEIGRPEDAAAAYRQAIELAPGNADAHNNLGAVLRAAGKLTEACAAYQKAIELDPEHADAHNNMGNLLASQGRRSEAVAYFCRAITLMPHHPQARRMLAIAYCTLGQVDAAAEVYRQWLAEEPDNPIPQHLLAACCGENVPARASNAFIEQSFDAFADSFDAKLEHLGYRAPQLVADALRAAVGEPSADLEILDAGCGTGLCGPLLAPHAKRLTGVDLSAGMLVRARDRGVYHDLHQGELTEFLQGRPGEFDVVVSADTLVYFGPLDLVFRAAHTALRARGLLIFTLEEEASDFAAEPGYRLNPHGRFSHCRSYVQRALQTVGFETLTMERAVPRTEGGRPVTGLVVTGRKTSSDVRRPRPVPSGA